MTTTPRAATTPVAALARPTQGRKINMLPRQRINLIALDQAVADSIKDQDSATRQALGAFTITATPDPEHPGFYLIGE